MITYGHNKGISALKLYMLFLGGTWLMLIAARLAFAVYLYDLLPDEPFDDLLKGFYIGCRFDGRIAAILTFPLGLILTIRPLGRRLQNWGLRVLIVYLLLFLLLWLVYAVDFGFYSYLGIRLNFTILELLEDFTVSLGMVWESYPVILICAGLFVAALLSALFIRAMAVKQIKPYWSTPGKVCAWLIGFIIFAWAAYGQVSSNLFPLRWSNAYFSPSPVVTALALNPLQNLWDTFRASKDDGFSLSQARKHYPVIARYLHVDDPDEASLNYLRRHEAASDGAFDAAAAGVSGGTAGGAGKRPNVVIIIMESMGHPKSSFAPGNADPTPFLKELAAESRYYPHFYSNARTTARAVFTSMTGIPDVTQTSTGSRNQLVVDQRLIANEFDDYDKYYMLGGNTNWANIRGILGNNISGLNILEERYWQAPNVDVWGISDWDLLMESHKLFTGLTEKPFLAVIQTSSFHKPYTIPDDIPGFKELPLSEEDRLNYGFVSEDEYNSMRFADYALREFFALARQSDYYRNTIFVLFGDHGINDPSQNVNASYRSAQLGSWHVPMLLHAPGRVEPGVDAEPASQIDVFPTVASLADISYNNWTLGRDLLDARFAGSRAAFISGRNDTPIRLHMGEFCYYDNRAGQRSLFRLDDPDGTDYKEQEPETFAKMRDLAEAFQHTAKYMLYNNKK
ncbi:sulfatase-like hydrolase/transferase [Desulfovibrio sp. OttesenSCG-928-C06]|nr:sulfatase-like hydrolase/transferase [Desulfovibrio sp. OttesenSCG-928-C06]